MKNYDNLGHYQNIDKIDVLDDGTMDVVMKNGKEAIIEIVRLNNKFTAAIYKWFGPFKEKKEKKNILAELNKHEAYQECAKEAIGWIDENPLEFVELEEIKRPD